MAQRILASVKSPSALGSRHTRGGFVGLLPALESEASNTIVTARVLCITTMMLVHVWPGAGTILKANEGSSLEPLYAFVLNDLARSSVPLLGAVSGFLLWTSLLRGRSTRSIVTAKARALLVPMVLWSLPLLALHLAAAVLLGETAFLQASALEWANRVLAVTAAPLNMPLGFLRDVFLCCAASALALAATRSAPHALALVFLWAWTELVLEGALLLRPQIAVLFSLGAALVLLRPRSLSVPWVVVAAVYLADLAYRHSPAYPQVLAVNDDLATLPHRLAMAVVFWRVSWSLAQWQLPWRAWEERIFLIFCSHMVTVSLMAFVLGRLSIDLASPAYLAVFLGQVPVIVLAAEAVRGAGRRWAPGLLALATGGRLSPARGPSRLGPATGPQGAR